jgi:hypothetical protein
MGFNKKFLPDLSSLKAIRERYEDDRTFLRVYLYSPDALIGSSESLEYLKSLDQKYHEKEKEK